MASALYITTILLSALRRSKIQQSAVFLDWIRIRVKTFVRINVNNHTLKSQAMHCKYIAGILWIAWILVWIFSMLQVYKNKYNVIDCGLKNYKICVFWRKVPDQTAATILLHKAAFKFLKRFIEFQNKNKMFQKSKIFVYFTKSIRFYLIL